MYTNIYIYIYIHVCLYIYVCEPLIDQGLASVIMSFQVDGMSEKVLVAGNDHLGSDANVRRST